LWRAIRTRFRDYLGRGRELFTLSCRLSTVVPDIRDGCHDFRDVVREIRASWSRLLTFELALSALSTTFAALATATVALSGELAAARAVTMA
jgi:hypothetical protein